MYAEFATSCCHIYLIFHHVDKWARNMLLHGDEYQFISQLIIVPNFHLGWQNILVWMGVA
jgi:hypothetical protein